MVEINSGNDLTRQNTLGDDVTLHLGKDSPHFYHTLGHGIHLALAAVNYERPSNVEDDLLVLYSLEYFTEVFSRSGEL